MLHHFSPKLLRRLAFVAVAIVVVLIGLWSWQRRDAGRDAQLASPRLTIPALAPQTLYFNPAARPWLAVQRPELFTAELRDPQSERSRTFAQAIVEPKLFRQLDRQTRFDTVLLVGDPSQYRPLLDHLLETADFRLVYLDHTSLIFRRGGEARWALEDFAPVRALLEVASPRQKAACLALAAVKLSATRHSAEARQLLEEARKLDDKSADVWSAMASYELERGEWNAALSASARALAVDKEHLGALATRAQAFFVTKRFNEAYALSQRLVQRLPEDPNILFKHAQIAHEAGAFKSEIGALEKLIALAEAHRRPTTGYRFYLAQAHAAAGDGAPALENFQRVLSDPDLPPDQRRFAHETIERIKRRTGL